MGAPFSSIQNPFNAPATFNASNYSSAVPYVESDKAARSSNVYEGIAGIIRTAGDVFAEIKYKARPLQDKQTDTPPPGSFSYYSGATRDFVSGLSPVTVVLGVGAVIALLLFIRRR